MRQWRIILAGVLLALIAASGCKTATRKDDTALPASAKIAVADEVARPPTDAAEIHLSTNPAGNSAENPAGAVSNPPPPMPGGGLLAFLNFPHLPDQWNWPLVLIVAGFAMHAVQYLLGRFVIAANGGRLHHAPSGIGFGFVFLKLAILAVGYVWLIVLIWRVFILGR